MRKSEFPFAKYRDWGQVPSSRPNLDIVDLGELGSWQGKIFKRPVFDDITGYYQFFPSQNGVDSYVTRAEQRTRKEPIEGELPEDHQARSERKKLHIARSAELATALFWAAANMRHEKLDEVISNSDVSITDESALVYAADAIADYGYCLLYPVDMSVQGDKGPGLKMQINRVAPGIGESLLSFGNYAGDNFDALESPEGVLALKLALDEQDRRINHWAPRHSAVLDAFPGVQPSVEVLNMGLDFPELFRLHHGIQQAV